MMTALLLCALFILATFSVLFFLVAAGIYGTDEAGKTVHRAMVRYMAAAVAVFVVCVGGIVKLIGGAW